MNRSNDTIDRIREEVIKCKLCNLCTNRTNAVPGEGNSKATVMFIGEAPGRNEDEKGRPFVGMAGKILDECLDNVGIVRARTYVTNIVKCRPPNNRVQKMMNDVFAKTILKEKFQLYLQKLFAY